MWPPGWGTLLRTITISAGRKRDGVRGREEVGGMRYVLDHKKKRGFDDLTKEQETQK